MLHLLALLDNDRKINQFCVFLRIRDNTMFYSADNIKYFLADAMIVYSPLLSLLQ